MRIGNFCGPLLAVALLIGCGERKSTAPRPGDSPAVAVSSESAQPVLSAGDAAAIGIKTPEGEGDLAWQEIQKALETLMVAPTDQPENPTKEQMAEFQSKQGEKLAAAAEKVRQFHSK